MTAARQFEATVLPCLDAAYNLARHLLHDEAAAQDMVQEAAMRAFRYQHALRDGDPRPWFLRIVRNTCFSYMQARRDRPEYTGLDDDTLQALQHDAGLAAPDPQQLLQQRRERLMVDDAIRALPPIWREVIVLREIEDMDYAQIALVVSVPVGTVMSRLSRARARLKQLLAHLESDHHDR